MTKAEERALEKYPAKIAKCIIFPETKGADFNTVKRKAYQEGYEQAEKDLDLTWEDIRVIAKLLEDITGGDLPVEFSDLGTEGCYKEVLRRFKEFHT